VRVVDLKAKRRKNAVRHCPDERQVFSPQEKSAADPGWLVDKQRLE
jgi:hypothetical protein